MPEVLDQGGNIVRHSLIAERAVNISCVPMPLQLHSDQRTRLPEQRDKLGEHPRHAHATVQHN